MIAGFQDSAAPATPRKLDYDPASSTLVIELLPRHRPLSQGNGSGDWTADLAHELGCTLALLHLVPAPDFDSRPPWILSLIHPPVEILREATYRQLDLIGFAQRSPIWRDALGQLAEEWTPRSLVHGDLRLSNILQEEPPDPATPALALIDWELAGRGDPSWDTAWVVAEILALRARDPARALPLLRSFWGAYVTGTRAAPAAATLDATLSWCAAACLQMAYEEARWPEAEARIDTLLQSGRSFLERRAVWIDRVFTPSGT